MESSRPSEPRTALASGGGTAEAVAHLTGDLFARLSFEHLGPVKTHLKRYFSDQSWTDEDAARLSEEVMAGIEEPQGWWEHELSGGFRLLHGFQDGAYRLEVQGGTQAGPSLFDRAFSGPVRPEATPNPRHVLFHIGGPLLESRWYGRADEPGDPRVRRLFQEEQVADVLVAGSFVTVGLRRAAEWEEHLERILALVTELFWPPAEGSEGPQGGIPTRAQLVEGGRRSMVEELHLLNPDEPEHRRRLEEGLEQPDARVRRVAAAVLAQAEDRELARGVLRRAASDRSRVVRRTVLDAAVDAEDAELRDLFEAALADEDAWIRWKAIRGLEAIGMGESREAVKDLLDDPDFQVRFEVAAALREA